MSSLKEKFDKSLQQVKEQTQKQYEKSKEAIKNYKPNQLHKTVSSNDKKIKEFDEKLINLEREINETKYKRDLAIKEKELAEEKLKEFE